MIASRYLGVHPAFLLRPLLSACFHPPPAHESCAAAEAAAGGGNCRLGSGGLLGVSSFLVPFHLEQLAHDVFHPRLAQATKSAAQEMRKHSMGELRQIVHSSAIQAKKNKVMDFHLGKCVEILKRSGRDVTIWVDHVKSRNGNGGKIDTNSFSTNFFAGLTFKLSAKQYSLLCRRARFEGIPV